MTERLARLLEFPQYLILEHFLRFWLLALLAIVVIGWLMGRFRTAGADAATSGGASAASAQPTCTRFDRAAVIFLVLSIACFLFLLLYKEDFACFDCDQLVDHSVAGHRFPTPIWPTNGRFFPLGMQEFNLLRYVTRSAVGYQSFAAVQLLMVAGLLFAVLKDCRIAWRALIVAAAIATPSLAISFSGLIYPERDALFWLAILVFCLQRADHSSTMGYLLGCLIATHFLLYYKEPLVVLVAGYAAMRLLVDMDGWSARRPWKWREFAQRNMVPLGMLGMAGIFAALFLIFMFPFHRPEFIKYQVVDRPATLLAFLQTDWWISAFVLVLAVRLVRWRLLRRPIDALWESLAVGALGYLAVIFLLGIYHEYYLAPVDLIAALYVGRLAAQWVTEGAAEKSRTRLAVVGALCVCLLLHGVAYSTLQLLDRKAQMIQEGELAKFLTAYTANAGEQQIELFFPLAGGYKLAQISSYLRYKGAPIAGHMTGGDRPQIVVSGKEIYPEGKCFEDKPYLCKHAEEPAEGGFLAVLPSDFVQESDLEKGWRLDGPLVSLRHWPESSWRGRALRVLHVLSMERGGRELPQPWWKLHIYKKSVTTVSDAPVQPDDLHPAVGNIAGTNHSGR